VWIHSSTSGCTLYTDSEESKSSLLCASAPGQLPHTVTPVTHPVTHTSHICHTCIIQPQSAVLAGSREG
jgi:hypothetical protein